MEPNLPVLLGLRASDVRDRLRGWIERLGYETHVTEDGVETLAWFSRRPFAASLLGWGIAASAGEPVWRVVRPIAGRRLVLLIEQERKDLWFEALSGGVGAVLPLPPVQATVEAALAAATGRVGGRAEGASPR
jgi:DNA-binding response OmpR family regulator